MYHSTLGLIVIQKKHFSTLGLSVIKTSSQATFHYWGVAPGRAIEKPWQTPAAASRPRVSTEPPPHPSQEPPPSPRAASLTPRLTPWVMNLAEASTGELETSASTNQPPPTDSAPFPGSFPESSGRGSVGYRHSREARRPGAGSRSPPSLPIRSSALRSTHCRQRSPEKREGAPPWSPRSAGFPAALKRA